MLSEDLYSKNIKKELSIIQREDLEILKNELEKCIAKPFGLSLSTEQCYYLDLIQDLFENANREITDKNELDTLIELIKKGQMQNNDIDAKIFEICKKLHIGLNKDLLKKERLDTLNFEMKYSQILELSWEKWILRLK